jgi:hypothetical protein
MNYVQHKFTHILQIFSTPAEICVYGKGVAASLGVVKCIQEGLAWKGAHAQGRK